MQAAQAIDHWKSSFGDRYTERNFRTNLGSRLNVWKLIFPKGCTSVLEVGANIGANLEAISQISDCEIYACEPNDKARDILENSGLTAAHHITADTADKIGLPDNHVDLVFTSGVLIHVPPDKLEQSLREIHRVSKRWIICGEYFAPSEEPIKYRGQDGLMWRRDYGSLYLDLFPDLKCTANLFAWNRMTGLDNITFWVFEKQG